MREIPSTLNATYYDHELLLIKPEICDRWKSEEHRARRILAAAPKRKG